MKNKENSSKRKKYTMPQLKKMMGRPIIINQYKATGEPAVCQISGCNEKVAWVTETKKGLGVILCFGHGEDL